MLDSEKAPLMSNRLYDQLKYATQIALPAFATLYFAVSQIWGLPKGAEVVGTVTAIDAFLGVLLGLSTASYNKSDAKFDGSIDVEQKADSQLFSLNLDSHPDELVNKDEVLFKVNKTEDPLLAQTPAKQPVKKATKRPAKKAVSPN